MLTQRSEQSLDVVPPEADLTPQYDTLMRRGCQEPACGYGGD